MMSYTNLFVTIAILISIFNCVYCSEYPSYCGARNVQATPIPKPTFPDNAVAELIQVNTVIRHGDRTCIESPKSAYQESCWPGDTAQWDCELSYTSVPDLDSETTINSGALYRTKFSNVGNIFQGNCELGQLTSIGETQHQNNGKMLKSIYVDPGYLNSTYSEDRIYVRADNYPRTIQSAQVLMNSMYPPPTSTDGNSIIRNINTRDDYYDWIEPNYRFCPIIADYNAELFSSSSYVGHYEKITEPILKQASSILGRNYTGMRDINRLNDCIVTHVCHQLDVPIPEDLQTNIINEYNWNKVSQYQYPTVTEYGRAGVGNLLNNILTNMQGRVSNTTDLEFVLLSGHDTTLTPMLIALGVWDGFWTPYASMIVFELYKYQGYNPPQYTVRMIYNGKEMNIPDCNNIYCDFDTFSSIVAPLKPTPEFCDISINH
eukprot:TRINITY_DN9192_c0_g1_i1.p1 TRINITY_DN9192_c0_g1~~TRINITY_DN9192_c0_g1_i1.p1  ORF type:complete len:432 (-),score=133.86 TRINITY_DN9192_c0_g1_i1:86-1381(-)